MIYIVLRNNLTPVPLASLIIKLVGESMTDFSPRGSVTPKNLGLLFGLIILFLQNEERVSGRRKSSVLFNEVLKKYEPSENEQEISENGNAKKQNGEKRSLLFPSSSRQSIFSRRSGVSYHSFQALSSKYQYFFLISLLLMVFLMGVIVGAIYVKGFLCNGHVQFQVSKS